MTFTAGPISVQLSENVLFLHIEEYIHQNGLLNKQHIFYVLLVFQLTDSQLNDVTLPDST